jgi:hypothetical protein
MSTSFWKSLTGEISHLFEDQEIQKIQETELDNLYRACGTGNVEMVNRCIENGIDPSVYCNYAIRLASAKGYIDVINILLHDGRINPSAESNLALKNAVRYGHLSVVDLLLQDKRIKSILNVFSLVHLSGQRAINELLLQYNF